MTQGRVLRSVGLELRGASAAFTLREVPHSPAVGPGCLEAGLVLSSPGLAPFSLWAVFMVGQYVEETYVTTFRLSGVGLSEDHEFHVPWAPPAQRVASELGEMPGWAAQGASSIGHDVDSSREAAAFLSGMVLASLSDAFAASLVRRACAMVSPDRVVELAREACVGQVMEG